MIKRIAKVVVIVIGSVLGVILISIIVYFLVLYLPHQVNLPSGIYLRSSSVYQQDKVAYDPLNPPAETGLLSMEIDRAGKQAVLNFTSGKKKAIQFSETGRVLACENHFQVEYIKLAAVDLQVGEVTFHEPVLMVTCKMWTAGEKIRPAKLILFDGPVPDSQALYMGMSCQEKTTCLAFGQAYGTLHGVVIDSNTGKMLPQALSTFENELGIQTFVGEFDLPLYAGIQYSYRIYSTGLPVREGRLANSYDVKIFIDTVYPMGLAQGYSQIIDMPEYGKKVDFNFLMDWNGQPTMVPFPTSTSLPTAPGTATPVPY